MRLPRKNPELNDAIEMLDERLASVRGNVEEAWTRVTASELQWIKDEIGRCMDRRYWIPNYFYMITENGEAKALYPYWPHQEMVSEAVEDEWKRNGCCKIIVLKGRQAGVSTWFQAAALHHTLYTEHCFTLTVAQDQRVSEHLQRMSVKAYENLPWWMRPEWRYKSKSEGIDFQREDEDRVIYDPGLGSVYKISHAQKMTGVAIGRTVRCLHASEISRWPDPEIFEADMLPSMQAEDGFYIMESTGLGTEGLFYDWWVDTCNGDTGWRPLFIPSYRVVKYLRAFAVKPSEKIILSDTEQKFQERVKREENYEIPLAFWKFRHFGLKRAKGKKKSGFLESYPITPDEAFQNSGLGAFDSDCLDEQAMRAPKNPNWAGEIHLINNRPQLEVRDVDPSEDLPIRKKGKGGHRLWIWEMPTPGEVYYVSADPAAGNGGDFSVCEVFRAGRGSEPDVQVAEWWGWISAKHFAYTISALAYHYNGAEIACEYQGPGITTGDELVNIDYPSIYRPQHKDKISSTFTTYKHWLTTIKTRDPAINEMQDALLVDSVVINSHDLIDEMKKFRSLDEGPGKKRYEGVDSNDDGVMAAIINLYALRETLKDLKTASGSRPRREEARTPEGKIWGSIPFQWNGPWVVRDPAMRPVPDGVFPTRKEAERAIEGRKGYTVGPHWAFAAANPWVSPIHQSSPHGYMGTNMQFQAKRMLGVPDQEITPDLISAFKQWKDTMRSGSSADEQVPYQDEW